MLECPICLMDIKDGMLITNCFHTFHLKCMKQALSNKQSCPMCRQKAVYDFEKYVYIHDRFPLLPLLILDDVPNHRYPRPENIQHLFIHNRQHQISYVQTTHYNNNPITLGIRYNIVVSSFLGWYDGINR
jgi:hypothetical protein